MTPTQNTAHVAQGLNYLTSRFRNQPELKAALTAFLNRIQDAENMLASVLAAGQLATPPTGNALDLIAALVGAKRSGFTDAQLLVFVKVYIAARKSGGRVEDILGILETVLGSAFSYAEWYPAGFLVTALGINVAYVLPLALALKLARPPAVQAVLDYSLSPVGSMIALADSYSSYVGRGLADSYSNAYPYQLAASIQV